VLRYYIRSCSFLLYQWLARSYSLESLLYCTILLVFHDHYYTLYPHLHMRSGCQPNIFASHCVSDRRNIRQARQNICIRRTLTVFFEPQMFSYREIKVGGCNYADRFAPLLFNCLLSMLSSTAVLDPHFLSAAFCRYLAMQQAYRTKREYHEIPCMRCDCSSTRSRSPDRGLIARL